MTVGPLHLFVFELRDPAGAAALAALVRERSEGWPVRLVELLVLRREEDGSLSPCLSEAPGGEGDAPPGAIAGGLLGFEPHGGGGELSGAVLVPRSELGMSAAAVHDAIEGIPPGACAVLALFEHRWAAALRDEMAGVGAFLRAQGTVDAPAPAAFEPPPASGAAGSLAVH
jgi:hypothetical protein